MSRCAGWRAALTLLAVSGLAAMPRPAAATVRAAYFYHHVDAAHLEALAAAGFNRGVIHWNGDSLGARGAAELVRFRERGRSLGIEIVPQWALQQPTRLGARPAARRYTWAAGRVEPQVACPLDSVYWRSALLDRAGEFLAADPTIGRVAVDLELYWGTRHHFVDGPCRCPRCLAEFRAHTGDAESGARGGAGLPVWAETVLERRLTALLREFAVRHPKVEVGVFDLDLDSFVHRALGRALGRAGVATANYCERSYSTGGAALASARQRLDALGLANAPLFGGLWLKRFRPDQLPTAVASVLEHAQGYFVFTTYSLSLEPGRLTGPYTLGAPQRDYWSALQEVNTP